MQTITAQAFGSGMRPGMQLVGFESTYAIEDLLVITLGIYVLQRPQFKFCIITISHCDLSKIGILGLTSHF